MYNARRREFIVHCFSRFDGSHFFKLLAHQCRSEHFHAALQHTENVPTGTIVYVERQSARFKLQHSEFHLLLSTK